MKNKGDFQEFQNIHGEWSNKTFGSKRNPTAPLHHLKKEVDELIEEPYNISEYADGFSLLIDAARLAGFNMNQILDILWVKFEINKDRKWGVPDENGVVEHIKDSEELLYTVNVICWDGANYSRKATKEEIDKQRKNGYVKEDGYKGITFDFRYKPSK